MTARRLATRTQRYSREVILRAAIEVFANSGFRGATLDEIASLAGMSKPNLLYYFPSKHALYVAALDDTLNKWLLPLEQIQPDGSPDVELAKYIEAKLEFSHVNPTASRLFANEVLHGSENIREILETRLKTLLAAKATVIRRWTKQGKLDRVDPYNLIFVIFAATQTFADFASQIDAVIGKSLSDENYRKKVVRDVKQIILYGIMGESPDIT